MKYVIKVLRSLTIHMPFLYFETGAPVMSVKKMDLLLITTVFLVSIGSTRDCIESGYFSKARAHWKV